MITFKVDCYFCKNITVDDGRVYCKQAKAGLLPLYYEEGHTGTEEDPTPVCCDYYEEEEE